MVSSPLDHHQPFRELLPPNHSRLQSSSQTRPSILTSVSDPSLPNSGILDMSFNRRSLPWSELQKFSPHSTCDHESHLSHHQLSYHDLQSPKDLAEQLTNWNFPNPSTVPPRLILWGPFSYTHSTPSQLPHQVPSSLAPNHLDPSGLPYPQTPPSYGHATSKRTREGYFPPAQLALGNPFLVAKRPRTSEEQGYNFSSPSNHVTNFPTSSHPITILPSSAPPTRTYLSHLSFDQQSVSIPTAGLSSGLPHVYHGPSPNHSTSPGFQHPSPTESNFPYSPSPSSPCSPSVRTVKHDHSNQYFPPSPVSPLSTHFTSSASHYQTPISPKSTCFTILPSHELSHGQIDSHGYSQVWSMEWHQTFNRFRNPKQVY